MAVKGIDATYHTVADLEKMTAFYSKVLGMPPTVEIPSISEWTFADDTSFGLYHMAGGSGRSGSVMFAVDDLQAAAQAAREAGAEIDIEDGATETPMCSMMFGEDPEGSQFILHKRKT